MLVISVGKITHHGVLIYFYAKSWNFRLFRLEKIQSTPTKFLVLTVTADDNKLIKNFNVIMALSVVANY